MSSKRRVITETIRVAAATAAAHIVWRAPVACRIVSVHGLRVGGAATTVNAQIGAVDVLAADLTTGVSAYTTAHPTGDAGVMDAGDVLSLEITATSSTPLVVIQVDIALDADVVDL